MQAKFVVVVLLACYMHYCKAGTVGLSNGQQREAFLPSHTATVDKQQKKIDAEFPGLTLDKEKVGPESVQLQQQRERVMLLLKSHNDKELTANAQNGRVQASDGEHETGANAGNGRAQATDGKHRTSALANNGRAQATDGKHTVSGGAGNGKAQATDGQHKANAGAQNGRALASDGRHNANGQLMQKGEEVVGGVANAAKHSGIMRNNRRQANLTADRRYSLDTKQVDRDSFRANGSHPKTGEQHEFGVDSETIAKSSATGQLKLKNSTGDHEWQYNVQHDGKDQAKADLVGTPEKQSLFAQRVSSWHCAAERDGVSLCRDNDGNMVGKVVANENGDANVYNKDGVVIGRGEARKISDEKYEVKVNQGLFEAKTKRLVQYDCYDEIMPGGKATKKIEIHEPIKFEYNTVTNADGTETYSWPDCFKMTADVTLPPGVDPKRIAMEYVVHVMPLGNLRCMDPGTCGRDCYYCNMCERSQSKQLDIMANTETDCQAKGGKRQTLTTTVCPPPGEFDWALCAGFDRHLFGNDYFKYNGSINAQIRAWLRPLNEDTLRQNFFDRVAVPLQKQLLQGEYAIDMAKVGVVGKPEDNELLEWYVRKNGHEELMACRKAIVDYDLGGEKVNSNLMVDAFTNVATNQKFKFFSQQPCDEWRQIQQAEYAIYKEQHESKKSGGLLGRLGGVFQRRS
jgi:hypothetical protein